MKNLLIILVLMPIAICAQESPYSVQPKIIQAKDIKVKNSLISKSSIFTDVFPLLNQSYVNLGYQYQPSKRFILELSGGKNLNSSTFSKSYVPNIFSFDSLKYNHYLSEAIHIKLFNGYLNQNVSMGIIFSQKSFQGMIKNQSNIFLQSSYFLQEEVYYSIKQNTTSLFVSSQINAIKRLGVGWLFSMGFANQKIKDQNIVGLGIDINFKLRLHYYL